MIDGLSDLEKQLINDEGLRLKPYKDSVGKLTIGIGRNLDDVGISEDEAIYLMRNDIKKCQAQLSAFDWYSKLSAVRKNVIINMCFNLGFAGLLKFKNLIAAINANDYHRASIEMLTSKWADQVKNRAVRLAKQMELG